MIPLFELPVLIVDCQGTGAASAGGHLLEIGWLSTSGQNARAVAPEKVSALRLRLPVGASIPHSVQRITGIGAEEAEAGFEPGDAWHRMVKDLGAGPIPSVIHYARFEQPLLSRLHREVDPEGPFPLKIVCTHEVVRRLLPDLPRKGLRAVAGYFDYGMPAQRRCAEHVAATARIWFHLCRLLRDECAVDTWPDLLAWLETTPVPAAPRRFPMDLSQIDHLPERPGVYRMHRKSGALLYVGKAASLRRRVASYFRPRARHPEHILEMLTQARVLESSETGSALEAALVEAGEIHRFSPPYNRALRPEGRRLWFTARDFSGFFSAPDDGCPVGPLPDERTAEALSALGRICRNHGTPETITASLGISPERAPDAGTFFEGAGLFRFRHGEACVSGPVHHGLGVIARRLWEEKMKEAAAAMEPNGEPEKDRQEPAQEKADWTPAVVAGRLESMLCHAGRMLRRARWFVLLAESVLVWRPASEDERRRHLAVFEKGRLTFVGYLAAGGKIPIAPGHGRPIRLRRGDIDLPAYDTMRVLTTEMRRLLAENRNPVLRLSGKAVLGPAQLSRALFWF
jgi:DNA polymerase III epsilon subunit-like protein